mgnify:CR=1 FL=1
MPASATSASPTSSSSESHSAAPANPSAADEPSISVGDRLRRWLGRKDTPGSEMPAVTPPAAQPASPSALSPSAPPRLETSDTTIRSQSLSRAFELDAGIDGPSAITPVTAPTQQTSEPAPVIAKAEPHAEPARHEPTLTSRLEFAAGTLPADLDLPVESTSLSAEPSEQPMVEEPSATKGPAPSRASEPRTIVVPIELDPEDISAGVVLQLEIRAVPRRSAGWSHGRAA